ncbi:MBL fold metallo-hydrolase [Candidatus Parcubacteria bacterium]|nr:MAG: MBL fold metallo-hydrolase [Candidatus Parcubacteria bacterium]
MTKIVITLILMSLLLFSLLRNDNKFKINFLDIGQGDAILITTPDNQNILIDGGPDNLLLSELAKAMDWWERDIDYLIISHYHADHMVGFIELLNRYRVKNVLVTGHQPEDFLYRVWTDKLSEKNIIPTIVYAGDKFILSDDLSWQVLSADTNHEDYNENSLVMRLTYKDTDFMLTGDLGEEGEARILQAGFDISSEYLKVGHHGSRWSSSQKFLEAISPQFCIIQSGKDNKFGHPHQETIDRLNSIGCQIMDNQNLGIISFKFD